MANEIYLGTETADNTSVTIGTTSLIASRKKKRISYLFRNISAGGQVITLSLSNNAVAVAGKGIVLNPNDGIIDSNNGSYICWQGDIQAVASAAGAVLTIQETY